MPVTFVETGRTLMGRVLIVAMVVLAFVAYALICKVWGEFESFGFPFVIGAVGAILHGAYWASNKAQRVNWSPLKAEVIYVLTLFLVEVLMLTLFIYGGRSSSVTGNGG